MALPFALDAAGRKSDADRAIAVYVLKHADDSEGMHGRLCARTQEQSALSGPVSWGRSAKMDWVSEVLQFPVIIERGRVFSVEPQLL